MATPQFPEAVAALDRTMRYVKDFPEPGVIFQDLTPALADARAFHEIVVALARVAREYGAELIGGLDARGFLLGSAVAYELGLGVVAIRKKGKLPPPVVREEYALEYGKACLEVPAEGMDLAVRRVVLIDDVLATGGTLVAAGSLLERVGAVVAGHAVVLEVPGLGGREKLGDGPLTVVYPPNPEDR
ncbi:adenine phosphoribosyltransferase [Corynebacterium oculi]|uniref:Adenine phosphoribosyltransferase n=1 Tax=Corynebacterium oculi TaxID=1544416 RepID=A0A0Q0UC24_9CORY|nr:adenine phosphoribosyltransferase [Corynebacterium oculi]KQB85468.1 Adenine phosphoribosyltransferase [Corynebacterium oculi]